MTSFSADRKRQRLLDFIDELLKGDVNDKDYQKQIIDHLVSQVFVGDDDTVVYFNIRGGKNTEQITLNDTKETIENNIKGVQTLTSPLHRIITACSNAVLFLLFYLICR